MPTDSVIVRVFVASPNDVAEERAAVLGVVQEINDIWGHFLGIRLELVRWETHAFPGIGQDPQDVINREIGDDYDIFLGILANRFGTRTQRAESGTAEEFIRARDRFRADPESVRIMFYFKDRPVRPSSLDLEQFSRVQSFRGTLGGEGVLYWTFFETNDFLALTRRHLSQHIQSFIKARRGGGEGGAPAGAGSPPTTAPRRFHSVFISYGGPDVVTARRIADGLRQHGVSVFLFDDSVTPGKPLFKAILEGINHADKVLLLCSAASLARTSVLNELEETLNREAREGGVTHLIPVALDDFVFTDWSPSRSDLAAAIRDRVISDFRHTSRNDVQFQSALNRLLLALETRSA